MNIPRPLKFCIVGGTGVIVNTGMLYICKEYAGSPLLLSSVVAIGVAMLWNFYWNDIWSKYVSCRLCIRFVWGCVYLTGECDETHC